MTSEELVAEIQAGSVDLTGQLWEQVEGLVKWKAKRIMTVLEGCPGRGVEFEDLYQSGYLAMVAAVDTYDPASGASFSTWLMYHLKTVFAEATGYRTQKGRQEPLNNYTSLDTPLSDDADSDDLMDVIADGGYIVGHTGQDISHGGLIHLGYGESLDLVGDPNAERASEVSADDFVQKQHL